MPLLSCQVRVWEINNQGQSNPSGEQAHAAPVLSCAWNPQGNQVATGVADKSVMLWDLGSNQMKQIGGHDAPVKEVHYFTAGNSQMVVSGSWDRTICYWDMRQEQAAKVVKLPERVWTMDLTGNLLTAILGNNEICVFDLNNPDRPVRDVRILLQVYSSFILFLLLSSESGSFLLSIRSFLLFHPSSPWHSFPVVFSFLTFSDTLIQLLSFLLHSLSSRLFLSNRAW